MQSVSSDAAATPSVSFADSSLEEGTKRPRIPKSKPSEAGLIWIRKKEPIHTEFMLEVMSLTVPAMAGSFLSWSSTFLMELRTVA